MKTNTVTAEGSLSGDCECWCFDVDKETYEKVCGKEDLEREIKHRKRMNEDGFDYDFETFQLYPHDLIGRHGGKVKLTVITEFLE